MPGTKTAERVVHAWANSRELEVNAYWSDGRNIYHYATCILAHVGDVVILNTHYYSKTTSMFQRVIKDHLIANNIFFMEFCSHESRKGARFTAYDLYEEYERSRMAVQYGSR